MKKAALITGGVYTALTGIEDCDFIIACDKGYEYCVKNNIRPDLLIGDFDSYRKQLPEDIEVIRLPVVKDDTDTMHAYREIINRGFDEVYLYCALGGRLDHSYANLQCAIFGARNNVDTYFINDEQIIVTDKKEIILKRKQDYGFSVFAADKVEGLSITGGRYEVQDICLRNDFPLGQSNEWKDDKVTIRKEEGVLIIIESKLSV